MFYCAKHNKYYHCSVCDDGPGTQPVDQYYRNKHRNFLTSEGDKIIDRCSDNMIYRNMMGQITWVGPR